MFLNYRKQSLIVVVTHLINVHGVLFSEDEPTKLTKFSLFQTLHKENCEISQPTVSAVFYFHLFVSPLSRLGC